MKKMLFALICLGLGSMVFTSCESPVGPTHASTVEFMFMREIERTEDVGYLYIVKGATGGGYSADGWRRIGPNEWIGDKYLDYSGGAGYYVFVTDYDGDKGRIIFARDKDKGQDWVELTDILPSPDGQGECARLRLGERGVYF